MIIGAIVFLIWSCFLTIEINFSLYCLLVAINLFFLLFMNNEERQTILRYIIIILVVCSLPSILYYILFVLNINVPYTVLSSLSEGKTNLGIFYRHYPFGLIITGYTLPRPSGLFDEPGYMGTFAGILYAAIMENKDTSLKKWKICLIVIGVFSFSLAFYILLIARLLIYASEKGFKKTIILLPLLLIAFGVFLNVDFHNEQIQLIQERLRISDNRLSGDNRTTKSFDIEYESFLHEDMTTVLRGNGLDAHMQNSRMVGSSSYKILIYNYGIIGSVLLLLLLYLIVNSSGFSKSNLAYWIIYLLSMYQRPGVFTVLYMGILVCGLEKNSVHQSLIATLGSFLSNVKDEEQGLKNTIRIRF